MNPEHAAVWSMMRRRLGRQKRRERYLNELMTFQAEVQADLLQLDQQDEEELAFLAPTIQSLAAVENRRSLRFHLPGGMVGRLQLVRLGDLLEVYDEPAALALGVAHPSGCVVQPPVKLRKDKAKAWIKRTGEILPGLTLVHQASDSITVAFSGEGDARSEADEHDETEERAAADGPLA